jgi:hypothetical protein
MVILVAIVIFWPSSVTYWIDKPVAFDPSKVKIELEMPEAPPPLDFGNEIKK